MAQTYEVDIQRYNGTDYDKVLPTPAKHASSHVVGGDDVIVCKTGNYADKSVTKGKLADNATHNTATVTLSTSGWSDNVQTVSVTDVTASNTVIVSPAPTSLTAYGEAGVYCSAQAAGTLTFTCEDTPEVDLAVNVVILV